MTLVTSKFQDWADEGVKGADGVIIFQPALPILDGTSGVATTTEQVQMPLDSGEGSRAFDPTPDGQAVAITVAEMAFPAGPYFVVIPDVVTISVVELILDHQVEQSTLQPIPAGSTALELIAEAKAMADAASATAADAQTAATAVSTVVNDGRLSEDALSNTFVAFRNADGTPAPSVRTIITLDAFGEPDDIITEAV